MFQMFLLQDCIESNVKEFEVVAEEFGFRILADEIQRSSL